VLYNCLQLIRKMSKKMIIEFIELIEIEITLLPVSAKPEAKPEGVKK